MKKRFFWAPVFFVPLLCVYCFNPQIRKPIPPGDNPVTLLQKGDFYQANMRCGEILSSDPEDADSLLVRAISQYIITSKRMGLELKSQSRTLNEIDVAHVRYIFFSAEADFARIQSDLDKVLKHKDISIVLSPSRWRGDWNLDGDIDEDDSRLFQIEHDASGNELDEEDQRRNPTYRFDYGDVLWASAYIHFQRAALDLLLAYDWSVLTRFRISQFDENDVFVIKLIDRDRMNAFRQHLLSGLQSSDKSRLAYLEEKDDDREWVPNPSQKNHPMPMELNSEFYGTWERMISNLSRLAKGEDLLDPSSVFGFFHRDYKTTGAINLGGMISHPKDIELKLSTITYLLKEDKRDELCSEIFGEHYILNPKNISPIINDVMRMNDEVRSGGDTFMNKLKYLIWVN